MAFSVSAVRRLRGSGRDGVVCLRCLPPAVAEAGGMALSVFAARRRLRGSGRGRCTGYYAGSRRGQPVGRDTMRGLSRRGRRVGFAGIRRRRGSDPPTRRLPS